MEKFYKISIFCSKNDIDMFELSFNRHLYRLRAYFLHVVRVNLKITGYLVAWNWSLHAVNNNIILVSDNLTDSASSLIQNIVRLPKLSSTILRKIVA